MIYSCIFVTISTEIQSPYTTDIISRTFAKVGFLLSECKDIKWWVSLFPENRNESENK